MLTQMMAEAAVVVVGVQMARRVSRPWLGMLIGASVAPSNPPTLQPPPFLSERGLCSDLHLFHLTHSVSVGWILMMLRRRMKMIMILMRMRMS